MLIVTQIEVFAQVIQITPLKAQVPRTTASSPRRGTWAKLSLRICSWGRRIQRCESRLQHTGNCGCLVSQR